MAVLGSAALALLIVSALSFPAEARRGHGGHGWHGGGPRVHFHSGHRFGGSHFAHRHFHRPHFHHRHFHHRHFRHFHGGIFFGGPVFYGYHYGNGCHWLRRRALYTGSPYWWRRYRACLAGYY
jgi:hypothetical protein